MTTLIIGAILGAVIVLVGVCMAEPNYRDLIRQEEQEKMERTQPNVMHVSVKDMPTGAELRFDAQIRNKEGKQ